MVTNAQQSSSEIAKRGREALLDPSSSARAVPRPAVSGGYSFGATAPTEAGPVGGNTKRAFDIAGAIAAIILLLPLFCLIAIIIKAADGGPIFFLHSRIGRSGSRFHCFKFRTMVVNADDLLQQHLATDIQASKEWAETRKLKKDPRITSLGVVLRKTSIDELPQLFNILKGEMSFVGPRPIVSAEVEKYGEDIACYFLSRPGLTGQWQTSGRNNVSYHARVELDRWYVENWTFWKDIVIILKTLYVVVTARGCY
jgi:exopolysaccharide production protein ExoY